jgi:hypothetical protein
MLQRTLCASSGIAPPGEGSNCRTKGRRNLKLDEVDFEIQNHEILKLDDPGMGPFHARPISEFHDFGFQNLLRPISNFRRPRFYGPQVFYCPGQEGQSVA